MYFRLNVMLDYKPMKTSSKGKFHWSSVTKKPNHNCFACDMTGWNNIKPTLIGCVWFRTISGCQNWELLLPKRKLKQPWILKLWMKTALSTLQFRYSSIADQYYKIHNANPCLPQVHPLPFSLVFLQRYEVTNGMNNLQTAEAEAQAVLQQAKMQVAVVAGPVSTAGVLLRLNSTMSVRKMVMELRPKIFTSSCQLRNW